MITETDLLAFVALPVGKHKMGKNLYNDKVNSVCPQLSKHLCS